MVLYIPSAGTEPVRIEQYLVRGWYPSCGYSGCDCPEFKMTAPPGWHPDPAWNECATKQYGGGHGGCPTCIMMLSQAIADYHTEVTFMSNPPGAQIFIDGVEWWPGAVTAVDGATFRGISPVLHTYELRMVGYLSITGTFGLALDTPITVTGNLVLLGIKATGITTDKTSCTSPCNVNVGVTWINDATTDMVFTPSLMIDGVPVSPAPYLPETLPAGGSVTHTFSVTGLAAGPHTICAYPDSGTCVTINVLTPANIVATAITPSKTTCTEPCDLTVDITWTNSGETSGTFIPTIKVNGTPTTMVAEPLDPGLSVTKTFSITGLMAGTHNICSDPNTLPCATVTVLTPANIVATAITPSKTTCTEPCDLTVDITWTNNGETTGTFIPTIKVNGIPTALTSESLNFGQSTTHTFQLTDLTAGTHNICSDPNTLPCTTVTVLTPANVISATLTVDTNDCVAPCTVNGTVSWTNNGGTASPPTDLVITFNGGSTTVASAVVIGPGETTAVYPFTISNLAAGTYIVQASPNTNTTPQTITVRTPANIVATAITPSKTTCTESCDLIVDITWTNNGQMIGTFTPTIVVNSVSTPLIPENLNPGQSTTKTFPLTGMTVGTYNICADPNTITCATVTVERAAAAGGGAEMLFGLVGLAALGMMITSKPKERASQAE